MLKSARLVPFRLSAGTLQIAPVALTSEAVIVALGVALPRLLGERGCLATLTSSDDWLHDQSSLPRIQARTTRRLCG